VAASCLHAQRGPLGAFLRRKKAQLGAPQAVTATAHKLARLLYQTLKHGVAYVRRSQADYEQQFREQQLRSLKKKARQLGVEVLEPVPAETASASPAG
jgi:hypothetical protein